MLEELISSQRSGQLLPGGGGRKLGGGTGEASGSGSTSSGGGGTVTGHHGSRRLASVARVHYKADINSLSLWDGYNFAHPSAMGGPTNILGSNYLQELTPVKTVQRRIRM